MLSDVEVVGRCRRGDPAAWAELYRRHAPTTARFLYRLVGHGGDIDDLVQQVFVELVASLDRFRADARFTTWLYGITAHVACDRLRGDALWHRRNRDYGEWCVLARDDSPDPADGALARAILEAASNVLGAMDVKLRVVWVMNELEGLDSDQIGKALGIPATTVRVRLFRARRELRDELVAAGFDRATLGPVIRIGVQARGA